VKKEGENFIEDSKRTGGRLVESGRKTYGERERERGRVFFQVPEERSLGGAGPNGGASSDAGPHQLSK